MVAESSELRYLLDDSFFAAIDAPEVQRGEVEVNLRIRKTSHAFEFDFRTEGYVWVSCDRCLDDMKQPISSLDKLLVKFCHEYAEEGDNLVVIPEEEGTIDLAWYMYEFIALGVPMKHVHAEGECNEEMRGRLSQLLCTTPDEDLADDDACDSDEEAGQTENKETPVDPRWNELKKILDNN